MYKVHNIYMSLINLNYIKINLYYIHIIVLFKCHYVAFRLLHSVHQHDYHMTVNINMSSHTELNADAKEKEQEGLSRFLRQLGAQE